MGGIPSSSTLLRYVSAPSYPPFDGQNPFIAIYHSLSLAGGPVATKRWNNLDAGRLLSRLRLPGKIRRKFFSEARCIQ
jgi:hypothetical protein